MASRGDAASVGGHSRANASAAGEWAMHEAEGSREGRVATLALAWDAASTAAAQRNWSIAGGDSMRCARGDHGACGPHLGGPRVQAFLPPFSREPRMPLRHDDAAGSTNTSLRGEASSVTPVAMAADVVSEPVTRRWEIRTRYTLAQAFRVLSSCATPYEHAVQIADDLFSVSTHPGYTSLQREALRAGAVVVDQLTGLAPQVFLLQSVCKAFRIIADLLDGKPLGASDMLDISMLNRHLMTLRRAKTPLYAVREALRRSAPRVKQGAVAPARSAHVVHQGLQGMPRRQFGSAALDDELDELSLTAVRFTQRVEEETLRQSTPDDVAALRRRQQPDGERPEDRSEERFASPSGSRGHFLRPLEVIESDGVRDEAHVGNGEETPSIAGVPEAQDRESIAIREISRDVVPPSEQWAMVQSVPIFRRSSAAEPWGTAPLSEYRADIDVRGRGPGERFNENGQEYAHLDGGAFAVRELLPWRLWIVDKNAHSAPSGPHGERLRALPLHQEAGRWILQAPHIVDVAEARGGYIGSDGFIRYDGRKFVEINGMRVEVSRATIDGEREIARFAQRLGEALPGADAMQIIRLADGRHWLEGEFGYYRLRFDTDIHEFYIAEEGEADSGHQVLVDFDVQRRRWSALVPPRENPFSDAGASGYIGRDRPSGRVAYKPAEVVIADPVLHSGSIEPVLPPQDREAAHAIEAPEPAIDDRTSGAAIDDIDEADESPAISPIDGSPSMGAQEMSSEASSAFPRYTSDKTGVEREAALFEHYAAYLKKFRFFSLSKKTPTAPLRRGLHRGLRAAFDGMASTSAIAANRMAPELRHELTPLVLGLRQRIKGLYPDEAAWKKMTLPQKQIEVSRIVRIAYDNEKTDMWPCMVGYCNEMADVMLNVLTSVKPRLRDHLIQIGLHDQRGIRATHAMLVYVDQPDTLSVFGDFSLTDVGAQREGPTLNEAELYDWLLKNRDQSMMIDAWATNKVLDFSGMETVDAVREELLSNVMEAGFQVTDPPRFKARAVLPERPAFSPHKGRREVARASAGPLATWQLLADWAATGDMPQETPLASVSADLIAAARVASLDGGQKAKLYRLAAAFDAAGGNATEPLGVHRRMAMLAGRAAFALRDAPDTNVESNMAAAADATTHAGALG